MRNILDADIADGQARLADGTVPRVADDGPPCAAGVAFRRANVVFGSGTLATITRIVFAGDLLEVMLRSGPLEICAHVSPRGDLVEGATIDWHIAPEHCRVLRE